MTARDAGGVSARRRWWRRRSRLAGLSPATGWLSRRNRPRGAWLLEAIIAPVVVAASCLLVLELIHEEAVGDNAVEDLVNWLRTHRGIAPAAILVAVALLSPWVNLFCRAALADALFVLGLLAGAEAVVGMPNTLQDGSPSLWLHAAAAVPVSYLVGKLWLLHRYARRWNAEVVDHDLDTLLPTQELSVDRLCHAVMEGMLDEGEHVVQVGGRWGDGKSFLLHRLDPALRRHLRERRPVADQRTRGVAVRRVDVWKAASEPDLHFSVVDEVLRHPAHFHPWGWLRYPLTLIPRLRLEELRLKLFEWVGGGAGVEGMVKLPRLAWQGTLDAAAARSRARGVRTVVVLDEIDRASSIVAQSAVTLMRRALGLAGFTIVLAYVEEVVDYKVFNPMIRQLPDLASSSDVVLEIGRDRGFMSAEPGRDADLGSAWYAVAIDERPPGDIADVVPAVDLPASLRKGFAGVGRLRRRRMRRAMSEKFLSSSPVVIRPLRATDFAELLFGDRYAGDTDGRCPEMTQLVRTLLPPMSDEEFAQARRRLLTRVQGLVDSFGEGEPLPPVRPLVGELRRLLRVAAQHAEGAVSEDDVVAWVLAAYAFANARLVAQR